MADKKISEMATASVIENDDNLELSHSVNGGFTSVKASILAIATKMLTAINFTSALETTNKTVIGAINEVALGGGGSDVEWTQIVQSGTKIAEIEIDGSTTNVYAPSGGGGGYTEVSGTLTAGQTSITLSDASITANSTIDVYTDADVEYNSISVSTGSVTITFDAQASNMGVKVRVSYWHGLEAEKRVAEAVCR